MTIDLVILGLVLFFGLIGAVSGAAKQIANIVGMGVAWFVSRRLGPLLGPKLAASLGGMQLLGLLAATSLLFLVVWVAVRYALGYLLQRLMAGKDPDNRGVDRLLGFVLGATKVGLMAYVVMSALTFFEQHVVVAGKRLGVSPKDSVCFGLARRYNLFELTQFSALKDLVRVAQVASDPKRAGQLQSDPAFQALRKDPRFQKALKDGDMRRALERGDSQALLRNNLVLQLIQDPQFAAQLGAASRAADAD
ncbi:CvpA family protein [Myxococcaceae bacterium GXIMD 01537]